MAPMLIGMSCKNTPNTGKKERHHLWMSLVVCALHILHGALQTGITQSDWNLHEVLHVMWNNFDESSARRDIYIRETCDVFPLLFCKTRWVEVGYVASEAIKFWQCVTTFAKYWLSLFESKQHNNKYFGALLEHHKDQLMIAKLRFLKYLGSLLKPFLICFQTEKPIVPLLATDFDRLNER